MKTDEELAREIVDRVFREEYDLPADVSVEELYPESIAATIAGIRAGRLAEARVLGDRVHAVNDDTDVMEVFDARIRELEESDET